MLQDADPEISLDEDDSTELAYLVALVDPPAGTPPSNQDLYAAHWPLLQQAIRRWEQSLGSTFHWNQAALEFLLS
jgi:hypothetical protein